MLLSKINLSPDMHIHLVGIGGAGLSAIAQVLLGRGYTVSGSDLQANELTADLAQDGAVIYEGHRAANIAGADMILVSSAVPTGNPEIEAADAAGVPVLKRAEFLGALMSGTYGIAVAGSHGKTTTTGMIAQIMMEAGLDPTVIVGGVLPLFQSNGRAGDSKYLLVEADEYDQMFLGLQPQIAVITNVEYDHPDQYAAPTAYQDAFYEFARRITPGGVLVACADDPAAAALPEKVEMTSVSVHTYGLGEAEWRAVDLRVNQLGGMDFLIERHGQVVGLARLRVPGEHNVRNALAAIAVSQELEIDFADAGKALAEFGGISRRFQVVGEIEDVTVIDDYAHHPTEIQATLAAARQRYPGRRLWAVWQPHTFSRTKAMLADFAKSFGDADRVVVLDVFRSREKNSLGIDTSDVSTAIEHSHTHHAGSKADAVTFILDRVRPGDVIVTLTAGDGNLVGQQVLRQLDSRVSEVGKANGSGNYSS
jgi:UDP-N-acetylmuramate--alanine ligase